MQSLRQAFQGILIALASIGFVLGGLSLSLVESNPVARIPTSIPTPTASAAWQSFTLPPGSPTPAASTLTPTPSQTPPPPTNCLPPSGWVRYTVQSGDTLEILSTRYKLSSAELGEANCLLSAGLVQGALIYVPSIETPTRTPCGSPPDWVTYIVKRGDTLYGISQAYGITVAELQQANCLTGSFIKTGQRLVVPPGAPLLATYTPYYIPIDTSVPVDTDTPTPTEPTPWGGPPDP